MKEDLMTDAQHKTLIGALTSAIQDISGGSEINEALAKHASENGLNAEFAKRMVEAYNASKTVHHIQTSEGEKRAATIPLADAEMVIKLMYKPTIVEKKAHAVSTMVNFNTADYSRKDRIEKTASALKAERKPIEKKAGMFQADHDVVFRKSTMSKVAFVRDELKYEARRNRDKCLELSEKIANEIARGDYAFEDLEKRLVSQHKKIGKAASEMIWSMQDLAILGEKRAEADDRIYLLGKSAVEKMAVELVTSIEKTAENTVQMLSFEKKAKVLESFFANRG